MLTLVLVTNFGLATTLHDAAMAAIGRRLIVEYRVSHKEAAREASRWAAHRRRLAAPLDPPTAAFYA